MDINYMNIEHELKLNIFSRAKIFIEDMGEFTPFGATYTNGKIVDVVYENSEEQIINPLNIVEKFIDIFSSQILRGETQVAAIAYNVVADFKNSNDILEKKDALCLKITKGDINWTEEYFPYTIIDNKCIWG